ncbi:MAG: hypothetical protein IIB45_01700 [Candidatus Marinimicrobia bacterium]|nr:hypothetical protein [Candidatus Neomarinimicrobiota bacterium]
MVNHFRNQIFFILTVSSLCLANSGLDIFYDLDIYFHPNSESGNGYLEGVNRIRVLNNTGDDLNHLLIHVASNGYYRPNDPNSPYSVIGKIRSSHLGKISGQDSVVIKIELSPPISKGESVLIDIPFKTFFSSWRNTAVPTFGSKKDTIIYNAVHFYPVLEYYTGNNWIQNRRKKDRKPFSNFSSYNITLTLPYEYDIGSSAKILNQKELSTGHIQYRIEDKYTPGFCAVIFNKLEKTPFEINGTKVEIITPVSQAGLVEQTKKRIEKLLPFYESFFGRSLLDKLVITVGYSLDAPAISLNNYIMFQDRIDPGRVLDHELAHQWFGNTVQIDEGREKWLNESFAEFASWLFTESQKSKKYAFKISDPIPEFNIWDELKGMSTEDWTKVLRDVMGDNSLPPIYEPGKQLHWEEAANIYNKYIVGNHALQTLYAAIGDSLMRSIMHDYYLTFSGRLSDTENFIGIIKKHTSNNIADNFRLALTTNLRPDLIIESVESTYNKNRTWQNIIKTTFQGEWILPVDVLIVTDDGDSTLLEKVLVEKEGVIELTTNSPITIVELDPYKHIFDSNRFNNRWPRQITLQLEYGLPTWETYEVYYRPKLKKDWRGNWRTGIYFSGGLGINLMPIMPAFYQNLFDLEITFSTGIPNHNWGGRLNYRTPLKSTKNLYWSLEVGHEYPKNWSKISLVSYIGETSYLSTHGKSSFSRLTTTLSSTEYTDAEPGDWWSVGKNLKLKEEWTLFSYSPVQRYLIELHALGGFQDKNEFYNIGFSSDYETHKLERFVIRLHGESGFVWDDRESNELAYRLLFVPKVWQQREGQIPIFRGVAVDEKYWNKNIFSAGFSLGFETNTIAWPMIYVDAAVTNSHNGSLPERIDQLSKSKDVFIAAGVGLESQTMMEIGLYFPLWVSHPIRGENNFALRMMMQWGFYF